MSGPVPEPGSFRDRNGRVVYSGDAVYRVLGASAFRNWRVLSASEIFRRFVDMGKLVATEEIDPGPELDSFGVAGEIAGVLRHQRIPFISYPYEWSFGMLKDAALLHLELLSAALDDDLILKDASAFNVQWFGPRPTFIDIPSFEILEAGEPWVGYRQFCQMFLYPLFLQAYKDAPFRPWLRGSIDGIAPGDMNALMSARDRLRPGVFTHVYLQAKLQSRHSASQENVKGQLKTAGFSKDLIRANVRRLERMIHKLQWTPGGSEWSDYAQSHNYSDEDFDLKRTFVRDAVAARTRHIVWDLGANTGTFSRIAAKAGAYVVATDADHLAVERLYRALKEEGETQILPLVMNLADPSPNLGWRGLERKDLTTRGRPDLVMALALIHHMVISANIPMRDFVDWLADLGTDLIIEFVSKDDPMVHALLKNKEDNYFDYEIDYFENCLAQGFEIARRESLGSQTRTLYYAQNKNRRAPVESTDLEVELSFRYGVMGAPASPPAYGA